MLGDIMQDNITNLDNAITGLDDAKSALENIE